MEISEILDKFVNTLGREKLRNIESKKYISDIAEIDYNSNEANMVRKAIESGVFCNFGSFDEFEIICGKLKDYTCWDDSVVDDVVMSFANALGIKYTKNEKILNNNLIKIKNITKEDNRITEKKDNNIVSRYLSLKSEEDFKYYINDITYLAEKGKPQALVMLACLNRLGIVFDYNELLLVKKAVEVYSSKSLNDKNTLIDYNLANLYCSNYLQNYSKAFDIYNKLSELKHTDSMVKIGDMYFYGYGTQKNLNQAKLWYEFAADCNNSIAYIKLAYIYYEGLGVQRDLKAVDNLLSKASDLGNADAKCILANFYKENDNYHNEHKIKKLYDESAELGNSYANYIVGISLLESNNDEMKKIGYDILLRSSYLGNPQSSYYLANRYYGEICEQYEDFKKIDPIIKNHLIELYARAGIQGDVSAMCDLGLFYYEGKIVDKNFKKSFYWYEKAAMSGNHMAMNRISLMIYSGVGTDKSLNDSKKWFEKAVKGAKKAKNNAFNISKFDFLV